MWTIFQLHLINQEVDEYSRDCIMCNTELINWGKFQFIKTLNSTLCRSRSTSYEGTTSLLQGFVYCLLFFFKYYDPQCNLLKKKIMNANSTLPYGITFWKSVWARWKTKYICSQKSNSRLNVFVCTLQELWSLIHKFTIFSLINEKIWIEKWQVSCFCAISCEPLNRCS